MNEKQTAYLTQYGLTEEEITSGTAEPAHRLQIANLGHVKDEPAEEEPESATVEETDAQKAAESAADGLADWGKQVGN